jgi:hypothetical protein
MTTDEALALIERIENKRRLASAVPTLEAVRIEKARRMTARMLDQHYRDELQRYAVPDGQKPH